MFEWMIGASLLMLAVILIRAIFKRKVKASLRYILYALILIRLLMPVSFVSSPFSFMNLQKMNLKALEQINVISEMETPNVESAIKKHEVIYETESIKSEVSHVEAEKTNQDVLSKPVKRDISVKTILLSIWIAGIFGLASYMILSNALYFRKLYITRTRVDRNFGLPVYESRIIKVPSLSGLFSPAIYLPMEDISKEDLDNALMHEYIHFKHKDPLWMFLFNLVLCIHWFNPLVWISYFLFKKDIELACDEGSIKNLGEEKRVSYGMSLIRLTQCRKKDALILSTSMAGNVKERIKLISKKQKNSVLASVFVILAAVAAVGCTMTAAAEKEAVIEVTETKELIPEDETLKTMEEELPVDAENEKSEAESEESLPTPVLMDDEDQVKYLSLDPDVINAGRSDVLQTFVNRYSETNSWTSDDITFVLSNMNMFPILYPDVISRALENRMTSYLESEKTLYLVALKPKEGCDMSRMNALLPGMFDDRMYEYYYVLEEEDGRTIEYLDTEEDFVQVRKTQIFDDEFVLTGVPEDVTDVVNHYLDFIVHKDLEMNPSEDDYLSLFTEDVRDAEGFTDCSYSRTYLSKNDVQPSAGEKNYLKYDVCREFVSADVEEDKMTIRLFVTNDKFSGWLPYFERRVDYDYTIELVKTDGKWLISGISLIQMHDGVLEQVSPSNMAYNMREKIISVKETGDISYEIFTPNKFSVAEYFSGKEE